MTIPRSHPRYSSLTIRQKLEEGVKKGITSHNGLIAHGRGEAFDYLLGEKTYDFALRSIAEAARVLQNAKHPVLSVNGNTAVLVPRELVTLSNLLNAPLEVNLFHSSPSRLSTIYDYLTKLGAKHVLLPNNKFQISHLDSDRKFVNQHGIWAADVVFVPLEDGDRTEALVKNGKTIITVDLNPLSRTAQAATITIVDNINRAMPLLIGALKKRLYTGVYDNKKNLARAEAVLRRGR